MLGVWTWLKKNWMWVLLPIGILIIISKIFGKSKTLVVTLPDSHATDLAIEKHDVELEKREEAAEEKAAVELKAIEEKHQAVIDQLNATQRLQYDELKRAGPQAVTDWLLRVGREDS